MKIIFIRDFAQCYMRSKHRGNTENLLEDGNIKSFLECFFPNLAISKTFNLDELTFNPKHSEDNFRRFTRFSADVMSETETVVSFAYCDNYRQF